MDTKRTVIGTVLTMTFVAGWYLLWQYVEQKYAPPAPKPNAAAVSPAAAPSSHPSATTTPTTGNSSTAAAPSTVMVEALQVLPPARGVASAGTIQLGSSEHENKQFALQLSTTTEGAGVEAVVLNNYLQSVEDKDKKPYVFQNVDPNDAPAKTVLEKFGRPLATRSVTVEGKTVDLTRANWSVEEQDATSVTYAVTLGTAPGKPVLKVLKTYRIFPRNSTDHPGLGFEIRLDYALENLSGRKLPVSLSYNGPALPPRELFSGPDQRVIVGYGDGTGIRVANDYIESFRKDETTRDLAVNDKKLPMWWAGGSSVYFEAIVMPPLATDGKTSSTHSFKGIGLDPEKNEKQPLAMTFDTTDLSVGPDEVLKYPMSVYFGPRHREVLKRPFYSQLPRQYDQALVVRAGPCSVCTFDWLINVLVAMLGAFHFIARDWGLAIICLVILVRLALHPVTKRSQVSMAKMGKMAPEMKRLQEKYKDDKEQLQKAMWEFQKQQGVTPVLGCLPMFLQMPIWIALWSALNTTFELRHSSFLWGLTWIHDLAKPDRLIHFPAGWEFTIPLLHTHVDAINLLPLLLAVVFWLQQKYQPKPPTMTKEQEQQQKMVQTMMVFLFPLFLYAQPSGLNLYILTSTGIGIWESRRIRAHIKEKEEAEKAGVVIVDAEPEKDGKNRKKDAKSGAKQKPVQGGWLARKLAELQEKADQAKRQADRRGRDRA
jgi:YidC/Oxa1 family membrane protein insertase